MPDNGNSIGKLLTNNYVWRSIFRHGYADTPRNRVLQVSANVWTCDSATARLSGPQPVSASKPAAIGSRRFMGCLRGLEGSDRRPARS